MNLTLRVAFSFGMYFKPVAGTTPAAKAFVSVEYFILFTAPPLVVPLPLVIKVVSWKLFSCTDWPKEPPKKPSPEPDRLLIAVVPA